MKRFDIICAGELQTQWIAETPEQAAREWGKRNGAQTGTVVQVREAVGPSAPPTHEVIIGVTPLGSTVAPKLVEEVGDNPETVEVETRWWRRILS